jgi:hypothetical protein
MTAPKYAACDNSGKFTWSKVYSYNQYNANTFSTKTRSLLIVHTLWSPNTAPSTMLNVVHAIRITEMCSLIWSTKAVMQIRDCWFICLLLNVATLILLLRVDLLQYSRSLYEDGLLSIKVLHYDPVLMYYWDTEQHHGAQDVYTEYSST